MRETLFLRLWRDLTAAAVSRGMQPPRIADVDRCWRNGWTIGEAASVLAIGRRMTA